MSVNNYVKGPNPGQRRAAGIYISIPFCAQKCTYCNFRSDVYSRALRESYVRSLMQELRSASVPDGDTLYFGGGSPSLLAPGEFTLVSSALPQMTWREATIEVAPGEANSDRIAAWVLGGINRVSLGVQTFDPAVARAAGRKHDPETVQSDVRRLYRAGIRSVSVDLIAGLAHQTASTWDQSLEWIGRLGVDHVSIYMLEADDASRLGRELRSGGTRYGAQKVPSENEILDRYLLAVDRLRSMGYKRYEVSNFARPGMRSVHNLKYWRMEPYYGFGSDAHSFSGWHRWSNVNTAPEYVRRMEQGLSPRTGMEKPGSRQMLEDRILTGLRTVDGVTLESDEWNELLPQARALVARGWLQAKSQSFCLTEQGILFADEAVAELLA